MIVFKEGKNRIYAVDENGEELGEVTFVPTGEGMLIIDHTGVDENARGQGLAAKLVAQVVQKAHAEQKKILPLCPFAKAEFERHPEYQEVQANR